MNDADNTTPETTAGAPADTTTATEAVPEPIGAAAIAKIAVGLETQLARLYLDAAKGVIAHLDEVPEGPMKRSAETLRDAYLKNALSRSLAILVLGGGK